MKPALLFVLMIGAPAWGAQTEAELAKVVPDFQEIKNFDAIAKSSGFLSIYQSSRIGRRRVKVAVFDITFGDIEKAKGKTLPADARYFPGAVEDTEPDAIPHGLKMAEALYAFATDQGRRKELAPEMLLFTTNGITNFRMAIDESIRQKVDLIVYPLVREFGNNFDGKGVFNTEVNRAIQAGIIWINSVGNHAKTTSNWTNFATSNDGWVELPGPNKSLPIRCQPLMGAKTCQIRLVLSWNSFSGNQTKGTNKDLDLFLTDDTLNILGRSQLVQTEVITGEGQTIYPRESITMDLPAGKYLVRIKNRSLNFSHVDEFRLVGNPSSGLSFEYTSPDESVLNPADNPNVLSVGAFDTDLTSKSVKLGKPDLLAPSIFDFNKDIHFGGSSNAAVIVTAAAALIMSDGQKWNLEKLKLHLAGSPLADDYLSARQLGIAPASGNCFEIVPVGQQLPYIEYVRAQGGVFVQTTEGLKLAVPVDPMRIAQGTKRNSPNDVVATTPEGWMTIPRNQSLSMPGTWAEVFAVTDDLPLCKNPPLWEALRPNRAKGTPRLRLTP